MVMSSDFFRRDDCVGIDKVIPGFGHWGCPQSKRLAQAAHRQWCGYM